MNLEAMRYKNFVWPHNPRVYTIDYTRKLAEAEVPYGRYFLQDMGFIRRILRGEGEFAGPGAYEDFKRLAAVFYQSGAGMLVHPVWQTASAHFTGLSLRQEPRANYVKYSFEFREEYRGYETALREVTAAKTESNTAVGPTEEVWHTVARGDTLWAIAVRYGVEAGQVIRLNPQLKNPNIIMVGERVRVK